MVDIIVFELPYVFAKCCDMPSRTIVEAVFVGGISLLEGSLSQADVSFLSAVVISMDCSLVYNGFIKAFIFYGT